MESIGLSGEKNVGKRLTVLRALDKYDRLGIEGVRQLLGKGRKDESGDFTKGAELPPDSTETLLTFIKGPSSYYYTLTERPEISSVTFEDDHWVEVAAGGKAFFDNAHLLDAWEADLGESPIVMEALGELRAMIQTVQASGYGSRRIRIDPSVVRGLEYYTGPVYEADLTFEIKGDDGKPVRFGSVAGGGRYDGLVARFRGEPVPATGFSIGVSRLLAALQHLGKIDTKAQQGPVVVTVFDKERIADFQRMVKSLRDAGIRAELYLGAGKMGPQFKYADKRNAPCVVIQGPDEKAKSEVQIKDLIEGAKAAQSIASHEEWKETRAAQFSVPEAQLVEAVRAVLRRHSK
jgi:histidyl-tRNA synthetase